MVCRYIFCQKTGTFLDPSKGVLWKKQGKVLDFFHEILNQTFANNFSCLSHEESKKLLESPKPGSMWSFDLLLSGLNNLENNLPIFFLLQRISGALISQSSIDSLFPVLLIFLLADSSADEARARVLKVEVGEELTDREDFEGLLVLLQLVKL